MLENRKTTTTVYVNPGAGKRLHANMPDFRFTWLDILCVLVSIVTYIADMTTDMLLVLLYMSEERYVWASLTLAFFIIPAVVVQVFSYRWHKLDGDKLTAWLILTHITLLAPIYRYVRILKVGFKARTSKKIDDFQSLYTGMSDVGMLRMFESLLESAPQLVLQCYLMILTKHDYLLTGISATFSLASLAWAIVAYSKALRQSSTNPKRISYLGIFFQALWRLGMISSRIVLIVLLASLLHIFTFICIGIHWMTMFVWLVFQETDFCETVTEERMFQIVLGFVYIFSFFNVKEGKSRERVYTYYMVNFMESLATSLLYWFYRGEENWYDVPALIIIWVGFFVGLLGLMMYYLRFHPKVESIPSCGEFTKLDFLKQYFICCCFAKTSSASHEQQQQTDNAVVYHFNRQQQQNNKIESSSGNGGGSRDKLNVTVEADEKKAEKKPLPPPPQLKHHKNQQQQTAATQQKRTNKQDQVVVSEKKKSSSTSFQLSSLEDSTGCQQRKRVEAWLDQHLHIMLLPTPHDDDDDDDVEAHKQDGGAAELGDKKQHRPGTERPAPAEPGDGSDGRVVRKLAASNSFNRHQQRNKKDDADRDDVTGEFARNQVTYRCGVRRLTSSSNCPPANLPLKANDEKSRKLKEAENSV